MALASRAALVATRSSRVVGGTRGKSFPSIATRSHQGASRASVVAAAAASEVPAEYVTLAADLVDAAAEITVKYFRTPLEIDDKNDASPVTIADKGAEAAMRALVRERFPTHAIFGEEEGIELGEGGSQEWTWVFDPIDGTKSFITGKPLFGTLIACLHRGTPVVGVIDQCVLDERWVGVVGRGTKLNGRPCKTASGLPSLKEALLYATTPEMFRAGFEASRFGALSAKVKRALFGADCYAYALLASGFGTHLVVEADLGLYDYCALVPVVQGAGGVITDWQGLPLTLQRHKAGGSKGRVVAAADARLHEQAVQVLSAGPAAEAAADLWLARLAPPAWLAPFAWLPPLAGVAALALSAVRRAA